MAVVLLRLSSSGLGQAAQVRGIPFAATQVITWTSAKGTTRTEGRIARNTEGSSYVEMVDPETGLPTRGLIIDVPGKRLITLDLVRHRYVVRDAPGLAAETVPTGSAIEMLHWADAHRSAVRREEHGSLLSTQTWLGTRQVSGLLTVGTRREQRTEPATLAAGPAERNAGGEAVQTDESWFSVDLKLAVLMTERRPATGETIEVQLTRILRTEPDTGLFAIPQGFSPQPPPSAPPSSPLRKGPLSDG